MTMFICIFSPTVLSFHHSFAFEWLTISGQIRDPELHLSEIIQFPPQSTVVLQYLLDLFVVVSSWQLFDHLTKMRIINSACKVLQTQVHQLLNPDQKNECHRPWGSTLESQVTVSWGLCLAYPTFFFFIDPSPAGSISNCTDTTWLANKKCRAMQSSITIWANELRLIHIHLGQKW